MDFIYVGQIVNTHGIKGEVRLISNFERKDLVFKNNMEIYIGNKKDKLIINSYRVHKNFDMLTFKDINDINDVLMYKGEYVYILRNALDKNITLKSDLINYNVIYKENNNKEYFVPYLEKFIDKIDSENKTIYIINMEGLIDED